MIKKWRWENEVNTGNPLLESIKEKIQARHISGWSRRLWPDGIGMAALLPLQAQKGTLPGLRLGRDNQHLRASRPPARAACWPQRNVNSQKKVFFFFSRRFFPSRGLAEQLLKSGVFALILRPKKHRKTGSVYLWNEYSLPGNVAKTCLTPLFLGNYSTICNRFSVFPICTDDNVTLTPTATTSTIYGK